MEDISLQSRIDVLTEQQVMIQDSAIAFIAQDEELRKVRRNRFDQPGFDNQIWQEMADLGWFGFLVPEAYGGMGLTFADLHTVLVQLGKGLTPVPFTATAVIAVGAIVKGDNEALKRDRLPSLVAGEWKPALAWQESRGGIDARATKVKLRDGRLWGKKIFVPDAGGADDFIVSVLSDKGTELYMCGNGANGLAIEYEQRIDGGFYGQLNFEGVPVGDRVASAAVASGAIESVLDEGRLAASAELLGVMTRALEISLDYMTQRVQFDKPIGSFQSLQHKAVDLFVLSEISRSVVLQVVELFDAGVSQREGALAASQVKARCSDAAMQITRETIQLHGAIGYTDEANIGLYLKRAMYLSSWLGNASAHRASYAKLKLQAETADE